MCYLTNLLYGKKCIYSYKNVFIILLFVAEENDDITPALKHCPYNYNSFWYGIINSIANNESNICMCVCVCVYVLYVLFILYIISDEICTHIGERRGKCGHKRGSVAEMACTSRRSRRAFLLNFISFFCPLLETT